MASPSPELKDWLDTQRKAGFSDSALRLAMIQAGYSAAEADRVLSYPQSTQGPASIQPPPLWTERNTNRDAFFDGSLPKHAALSVFNTQNVRHVHDAQVRLLMQAVAPRMAVFQGVLSDAECDELIALAKPRLDASRTVDRVDGNSVLHAARVSQGMFFQPKENPVVERLENRLSALLGYPPENGEGLQVLHYQPGGKYDPHNDFFDPDDPGSQAHLARGGQRVGTVIVYLNTPDAGGGTVFPESGLTVSASKGNALFFSYPDLSAAHACLHGGNPVIAGEKWIATKWIRQGRFN